MTNRFRAGAEKRALYRKGMLHGVPIALGYLSVSFGFGILAVQAGLTLLQAVGISATNLTSAGQAAGVAIIAAGGSLAEMIFTQLIINLRYSLMALSLTQKLDGTFTTGRRMMIAFGITDEIYAVAAAQPGRLTTAYMEGLILTPMLGWIAGTLLGAAAGQVLPASVTDALGILLYGMFIAIILPPCKKNGRLIWVILMAAAISTLLTLFAPMISGGFVIIISAVVSACAAALLFPVGEETAEK